MTELLAPAGNVEALDAAIGEGADAVYLGLKSFNARLRSSNFAWREFEATVESLHKMNRKLYVTVNTVFEESEAERLYRFLCYLDKIGPDGLIVQDFGVVRMCQEFFPNLQLHASTQMNVESSLAANLLVKQGLSRVVVARELGLSEIKSIKENSSAEVEMFVHGALCVSESGLCQFSSFLGGKSANRGMCTQACRRIYHAEMYSTDNQGYYFSPCDMQLIEHVPELMQIGVDSFKIEGRMKSAEYVGSVTAAYRYVMDHWEQDKKGSIAEGKRILSTDFARAKTDYWYGFKDVKEGVLAAGDKILNPKQAGGTGIFLGKISELREATSAEKAESLSYVKKSLSTQNSEQEEQEKKATGIQMAYIHDCSYDPDCGDSIRLHKKDDTGRESHKVRVVKTDDNGNRWIDVPLGFTRGDSVYLLQTKSMSKRYKRVLPPDLSRFRKQPGAEKLPILDLTPLKKDELKWFAEGVYVQVSTIADAYTVQVLHPVKVIIELNSETTYDFLNKDTAEKPLLPYSKKMIAISLDPFAAEGSIQELQSVVDRLIEKGYSIFVVNNLCHIEMLKGKKNVKLIAGPYLYTFNRWAVSFLENQNIMAWQMPFENGEDNMEETYTSAIERSRVLLPVFAYPTLFRIRFKLPKSYEFTYFTDKESGTFKLTSTTDGSFVMPECPFSIIDKIKILESKGWNHFLIDFSKTKVTKGNMKDLIKLIQTRGTIDGQSRFNWKEGFYNPEKIKAYQESNARALEFAKAKKGNSNKGKKHK